MAHCRFEICATIRAPFLFPGPQSGLVGFDTYMQAGNLNWFLA